LQKEFYFNYLWSVYLGFGGVIWNRIRRRQFEKLRLLGKVLIWK